jgi:hypothetical protein
MPFYGFIIAVMMETRMFARMIPKAIVMMERAAIRTEGGFVRNNETLSFDGAGSPQCGHVCAEREHGVSQT